MHTFRSFGFCAVRVLLAAAVTGLFAPLASAAPRQQFERGALLALNAVDEKPLPVVPALKTPPASNAVTPSSRSVDPGPVIKEDGTVVLSPFEADSSSFTHVITCGCGSATSGVRLVTRLFDVITLPTPEALLPFVTDPFVHPSVGRPGAVSGLLEGLPIATVVDAASIDYVVSQSTDSSWSDIMQRHAPRRPGTTLTASGAASNFASVSARTTVRPGPAEGAAVFGIFSAEKFGDQRWSTFLEGEENSGANRFRIGGQWRHLDGYGEMRLLRGAFEHRVGSRLLLEAVAMWHELRRVDPEQFRRESATARYDGLGFLNLDQLTAETRKTSDVVGQLKLTGEFGGEHRQTWQARARWQRQESEWISVAGAAPPQRRDTWTFDCSHRMAFADDDVHVTSHIGITDHAMPGTTKRDATTTRVGMEIDDRVAYRLTLFARAAREEAVPWISTGRWQTLGSAILAVAPATELRTGGQVGVKLEATPRFEGTFGVFHEITSGHEDRDWNWERTHALPEVVGNETRLPVSTRVARGFVRQGFFGSMSYHPSRELSMLTSWSVDSKNQGPTRGGNVRASAFANYEFRSGRLHGLTAGAALHYRNGLMFDDGYSLSGGCRADLMFTYRFWFRMKQETMLQLNLTNLAGRAWPLTRFAPDHGRQLLFTATQTF